MQNTMVGRGGGGEKKRGAGEKRKHRHPSYYKILASPKNLKWMRKGEKRAKWGKWGKIGAFSTLWENPTWKGWHRGACAMFTARRGCRIESFRMYFKNSKFFNLELLSYISPYAWTSHLSTLNFGCITFVFLFSLVWLYPVSTTWQHILVHLQGYKVNQCSFYKKGK